MSVSKKQNHSFPVRLLLVVLCLALVISLVAGIARGEEQKLIVNDINNFTLN